MNETQKITPLVPPGKILCFITGTLRKDTPEENVRQRWARALVDDYGYSKRDIGVETKIKMGRSSKKCDLTVFRPGAEHKQENILICIEVKRDDVKPSDSKDGDGQLISYMSACPSKFGLWVGQEMRGYFKNNDGSIELIADIPRSGDDTPRRPRRTDLKIVHELTSVFRRCHNYIHANGGLQKAEAFHEMLKLIFCKTYDEQEGDLELDFSISPSEQKSIGGQRKLIEERLKPLFEHVKRSYPFIFLSDETIKLEPSVAAYVVGELQFISILNSATDVKGEAYETLVGANLRGDRGEYFTPRNVCDMTVQMIMQHFEDRELSSIKVIDCCCGTGGFLVSWIDNLRRKLIDQEIRRGNPSPRDRARERIKQICGQSLFGLDINPFLVRTAQMNLVMHGDGSTNVHRASSLMRPGEWPEQARQSVPFGSMDVVITNPPFGDEVKVDDAHVLSQYQLASWGTENRRSMMPAEQLFMETGMNFLKPGGFLGVVIPDGILNNPGLTFLRDWLLRRSKVIASVALPKETFGRNKGVNNPSVLILQKFTHQEYLDAEKNIIDTSGSVFMCSPATSGIDKRGNTVFLRHPNGEYILDADGERVPDDQVAMVPKAYENWRSSLS
ncbi:restriction endonuclease subunit M [Leisingera aquaemixtae]|uniref:restriction endonuclease subunit M n=1 Tax=Leisingera aquaemixtae TaxID=1396826 RepID=UPI003983E062